MKNKEEIYSVYKITDTRNDVVIYIGLTKDFNNRKYQHFSAKSSYIDNYMYNENRNNFSMEIIINVDSADEAVKIEDRYIIEYNTLSKFNKRRSGNISKNEDYSKFKSKIYRLTHKEYEAYKKRLWYDKNIEHVKQHKKEYDEKKKKEKSDDNSIKLF